MKFSIARLNGWQRLWLLTSGLWLLAIVAWTASIIPTAEHIRAEASTEGQRFYEEIDADVKAEVRRVVERCAELRHQNRIDRVPHDDARCMTANNEEYMRLSRARTETREKYRALGEKHIDEHLLLDQIAVIGKSLAIWIGSILLLYGLGQATCWVRKGFQQAPP